MSRLLHRYATALTTTFFLARLASAQEPTPDEEGEEVPVDSPAPDAGDPGAAVDDTGEPSPSRPAPKGKGVIWGVVTDTKFKEPILEGPVSVVGTNIQVRTDIDGRYRLELPPGKYTLRFWYELHQATRVSNVVVAEGKVIRVDATLTPDESAVETVEVTTEADRTSLEGQTLERKRSASIGDGVGRAEIARTPDRNAAEAAQRVVGATIVGGRFVYVRGLGERYSNASLNGSPLPSSEPDRNTVPLDLFPALVIDSITITKTFTPDMAADFAGGSTRIATRQFPREALLQVSVNGAYNTASTFRSAPTYTGSSTDWLGYDGGVRSLPPEVPSYKVGEDLERPDGSVISAEDANATGRSINSKMSTYDRTLPPNLGGSLVVGNAWKIGTDQKLGVIAALNYARAFERRSDEVIRVYRPAAAGSTEKGLQPLADLRGETGIDRVRWGAFGSVTFELSPRHRLSLSGLHSQSADDEARELEGDYEAPTEGKFHTTRLQYVSRALDFLQLRGEHDFPSLMHGKLDFSLSLARAIRDEPDTRSNVYLFNPATPGVPANWAFQNGAQSGSHFFADQTEDMKAATLDWTQPFGSDLDGPKLKLGGAISLRSREFNARRFEYTRGVPLTPEQQRLFACEGTEYQRDCPDKVFLPGNVGTVLDFVEKTQPNDGYTAELDVHAFYVMGNVPITKSVRLIGGARIESTQQSLNSFDPFARNTDPVKAEIDETDLLPSVSLVFAMTPKTNMRLAATRTLARPQLRELAPIVFNPYFGGFPVAGNPDLKLTYINNFDMRVEYFPTLREVLAGSVFFKRFTDPIEEILLPTTGTPVVSYENSAGADVTGIELEARKTLGFLNPALDDFSLGSNLTLARSQVRLSEEGNTNTNPARPLSNQSAYVVNLSLDYSRLQSKTHVRVLYNVFGARLVTVGGGATETSVGMQDTYEQPRHNVDLTVVQGIGEHFEIKGTAKNLLFRSVRTTQEDAEGEEFVVHEYDPGATFGVAVTYTY